MNKQINQLTPAEVLEKTDKFPIQTQTGLTKNITGQQIKDLVADDYVLGWSKNREPGNSITVGKGKGKLLLTQGSANVTGIDGADFSDTTTLDSPAYLNNASIVLNDGRRRYIDFESFPTSVDAVISFVYDENLTEIATTWDLPTGEYAFYAYRLPHGSGEIAHAEGQLTKASGFFSHAEGSSTIAMGDFSHAEGDGSTAKGTASHAEGSSRALGDVSHAEGSSTAMGPYSHAEGSGSRSRGEASHAEGSVMSKLSVHMAAGFASHIEGANSIAYGEFSHTAGNNNVSAGMSSHAKGYQTIAGATIIHDIVSNTANQLTIAGDVSADFVANDAIVLVDYTGEDLGGGLKKIFIDAMALGASYDVDSNQTTVDISVKPNYLLHPLDKVYNVTLNTASCAYAEGISTVAGSEASHAGGNSAITTMPAEWARSGGNTDKHTQYGIIDMNVKTTDSTPIVLNIGTTGAQMHVAENETYRVTITAMAITETNRDTAEWNGLGLFKHDGTQLIQVGSRVDSIFRDAAMAPVKLDLRINDTDKTIELVAEGIDATDIFWYAKIDYIRMTI